MKIYMMGTAKKAALWSLVIAVLLGFLFSGCGRKAPPKPPSKEKPSTISQGLGSLRSQLE